MDTKNIEYVAIAVLLLLLAGSAVYILTDEDDNDETNELKKEIYDLNNDLLYAEAMLDRYDGVTVCVIWIEGIGHYEIYNGDNLLTEFINVTTDDENKVSIPINWKEYPGDEYSVKVYKNGTFVSNLRIDVENLRQQDTPMTVDTIDMSMYG